MNAKFICILSLVTVSLILTSCEQARRGLGLERANHNEFNVCDRPPLSMPPSIDLKPPLPASSGETEQKMMREKAQKLVMKKENSPQSLSPAETNLLQKANVNQRQANIREIINSEVKPDQSEEELVQKILFWQKPTKEGEVIDPVKEKQNLMSQKEKVETGEP